MISPVSCTLDVPELIARAGYGDEEVDAYRVSAGRFSSLEAAERYRLDHPSTYWNEVRMTLLHTEEFFDRIPALPGFGTADDQMKMDSIEWVPRHQRLWTPPEQRSRRVR